MILLISLLLITSISTTEFAFAHAPNPNTVQASAPARTTLASSNPQPNAVNPFAIHTTEPAPMGIADYGISQSGAYSYSTTSFLGNIQITALTTQNETGDPTMSFQLNVVLKFTASNGIQYVYWVQNVASYDTSSNSIYFIDNVWNQSSISASISSSAISGNGQVYPYTTGSFYAAVADSSLAGSGATLSLPAKVELEVNSTVNAQNLPQLTFAYDDGFGMIKYDTVVFPLASNPISDKGFSVDGTRYNPYGTYYDAELIMGGNGNGDNTTIITSDVALQLMYWNGHNYQGITNAYNFGSDTAEGVSNAQPEWYYWVGNGSSISQVSAGAGSLTKLYDRSQIAIVTITSPYSAGTLYVVNSTGTYPKGSGFSFVGGNVTVAEYPGSYIFYLYDDSGTLVAQYTETLSPGEFLPLQTTSSTYVTMKFSYSTVGGDPPTAPTLTYVLNGQRVTAQLTGAPTAYYMDPGSQWSVSPNIPVSSQERWQTNQTASGTVTFVQTINFVYYHQYSLTFSYNVVGGGSGYGAPTVAYFSFNNLLPINLATPKTVWVDAGSSYNYGGALPGSTNRERWSAPYTSISGYVNGPLQVIGTFYHQFSLNVSVSTVGGASSSPIFVYTSYGQHENTILGKSDQIWADVGSSYSYPKALTGQTGERWQLNSNTTSGVASAPAQISLVYYHQFLVKLQVSVIDGGSATPYLNAIQFGTRITLQSNNSAWLDAGSNYSLPQTLNASSTERWEYHGTETSNGIINESTTIIAAYVHQYYVTMQNPLPSAGTVNPPTGWYNASSTITLNEDNKTGWGQGGWIGSGFGAYTGSEPSPTVVVSSPFTESAVFLPGLTITTSNGGTVSYSYGNTSGTVPQGSVKVLYVPEGTSITLNPEPLFLYSFGSWSPQTVSSTITLTSPLSIRASFALNFTVVLAAVVIGALILFALAYASRRRRK